MAISMEEIKSLAKLSKLEFTDEELLSFSTELEEIISFADSINSDVAGDTHSIREVSADGENLDNLRSDEVSPSLESDKITSNALGERGCFSVRRVVK